MSSSLLYIRIIYITNWINYKNYQGLQIFVDPDNFSREDEKRTAWKFEKEKDLKKKNGNWRVLNWPLGWFGAIIIIIKDNKQVAGKSKIGTLEFEYNKKFNDKNKI